MLCCFNSRKNKVGPDANVATEQKETPREQPKAAEPPAKAPEQPNPEKNRAGNEGLKNDAGQKLPQQESKARTEAPKAAEPTTEIKPPGAKAPEPQKNTVPTDPPAQPTPPVVEKTVSDSPVAQSDMNGQKVQSHGEVEVKCDIEAVQKEPELVETQEVITHEEPVGQAPSVTTPDITEEPVEEGIRRQKTSGMNRHGSIANIPMLVFGTEDITDRERDVITRLNRARQEHLMVTGQLNETAHLTAILERTKKALNKDLKLVQEDESKISEMSVDSLTELEDGLAGALKRLEQFTNKSAELAVQTQQVLDRASSFISEVAVAITKIEEHLATVNAKDDELKKDIEKCHVKKETLTKELEGDESGVTLARIKRVDRDLSKASELLATFENLRKLLEDSLREINERIQSDVQDSIDKVTAFQQQSKESEAWQAEMHNAFSSIKSKITDIKKSKLESAAPEASPKDSAEPSPASVEPKAAADSRESDRQIEPTTADTHEKVVESAESQTVLIDLHPDGSNLNHKAATTPANHNILDEREQVQNQNEEQSEAKEDATPADMKDGSVPQQSENAVEEKPSAPVPPRIPAMPMFVVASEEETSKERIAAQQTMKLLSELDGYRTSDDTCMRTINLSTRCRRALDSDISDLKTALLPLDQEPPGEVSDVHIIKSIIRSADKKFISFRKMVETAKRDVMQGIRGKQELSERAAEVRALLNDELEQVKQELESETAKLQDKQKSHDGLKSRMEVEGESLTSALAHSEVELREVEDHVLAQQNRIEFLKGRLLEIDNRLIPQLAQSMSKDEEMNPTLDEFRATFESYLSVLRELKDKIRSLPATEDVKQDADFDKEFMAAVGGFVKDEDDGADSIVAKNSGQGGLKIGPTMKD